MIALTSVVAVDVEVPGSPVDPVAEESEAFPSLDIVRDLGDYGSAEGVARKDSLKAALAHRCYACNGN